MSIDGGGIGGVIPLEFLKNIQDLVGPQCPVQDLFDLVIGTSSGEQSDFSAPSISDVDTKGGLIALGLFVRQWTVSHSIQAFDAILRHVFHRQKLGSLHSFRKIPHAVRCWVFDGCYEVDKWECALKQQFGEDSRLFDYTHDKSHAKVAVTATTVADASLVVFSNYNGTVERHLRCGEFPADPLVATVR